MDEVLKLDRTWLCSVVFTDVVQYSVQSVALQKTWKDRLNRYLGVAIQGVPEADRVILDTGDGAAICFLGDPEAAMFCGLRLLGSITEEETKHENRMRVRTGINLGPVKLVRDINGNLNAIGDGINVGQRVMSFAGDDQVLVSRSFYEVMSCLSDNYAPLFQYLGVRRDKHVREHTVYELLPPGARKSGTAALATPAPAPTGPQLDVSVLERIEIRLAPIVGPMAHYLVQQTRARASTPLEMRKALMEFVPAKEDQERWLQAWDAEFGSELDDPAVPEARPPRPQTGRPQTPPPRRSATPPPTLEASVLERARRELAGYIGPMAKVIVNRAAARARTEDELYDLLAAEIASPVDREKFLRG